MRVTPGEVFERQALVSAAAKDLDPNGISGPPGVLENSPLDLHPQARSVPTLSRSLSLGLHLTCPDNQPSDSAGTS